MIKKKGRMDEPISGRMKEERWIGEGMKKKGWIGG